MENDLENWRYFEEDENQLLERMGFWEGVGSIAAVGFFVCMVAVIKLFRKCAQFVERMCTGLFD